MPAPVFRKPAPVPVAPATPAGRTYVLHRGAQTARWNGAQPQTSNVAKPASKKAALKVISPVGRAARISLAASVPSMEEARAMKNYWARVFAALEGKVKAEFEEYATNGGPEKLELGAVVGDGPQDETNPAYYEKAVKVTLEYTPPGVEYTVESMSLAELQRNTTPEIYAKCLTTQKKLIKEHAGEAVLKKCLILTKEKTEAGVVSLSSDEVK